MKSVSILAFAVGAYAHMEMSDPAPFRSKFNEKATAAGKVDYSMTSPLTRAQFPCKGYLSDLGTDIGSSVATWAPGSSQSISLAGTAVHGGGSCQASLSYDKGASFTVIESIMGGCPTAGEKIPFTVPSDAPSGEAVFAWTWFNKVGNSEMYMNCASVTIGGGSQKAKRADSAAFSSRPGMFVANLDNGCTSKQAGDVITFPNPGPDVAGQGGSDSGISGTCEAVNGIGGDTSSGGGSAPVASSPASSPASEASSSSSSSEAQAPSTTSTEAPVTTSEAAAPSVPGGVFITTGADAASTTQAVATSEPAEPSTSASPSSFVTSVVESSAAPSAAPSEASSAPAPSGSSDDAGSSGTKTGACTEEGNFNCVSGSQFQQCAGGLWSPARPMAPGTQCASGESKDLIITARARSVRRRVARRSN